MFRKLVFALVLAISMPLFAAEFYVATDGDDANAGTIGAPFATVVRAQQAAGPGDTVWIRGGQYVFEESQAERTQSVFKQMHYIVKDGAPDARINYWAYPDETPVFDFSAVRPPSHRVVGFYVDADWVHFKGLEITGIQVQILTHTESYCVYNFGSNNIYENMSMHDNQGVGIRHRRGGNNLFLNCDSYRNHDYTSEDGRGSNVDGFGCHPTDGGTGNIFRGCRAWFNSDDGFDVLGSDESVVMENCWAMYNGYSPTFQSLGDGNGFKLGGYGGRAAGSMPDPIPGHTIRFSIAVGNKASGFYSNHHCAGSLWQNNSAYRNGHNYNMLNRIPDNTTDVPGYDHVMRNNLGHGARSQELSNIDKPANDLSHNFFDLAVEVTDGDFVSLDEAQLTAPRKPDGSLPDIEFMALAAGSDLIDRGLDIGFPYEGTAPDLGAQEFVAIPETPVNLQMLKME